MTTEPGQEKQLLHLLVVSGPDQGKMFFVKRGKEALIGRAPSADLRLTDPGSSGKHCLIRCAGDVMFVEDLNSRNGTKLNGDAVTSRVLDENGILQIGTSTIQLNWVATGREVPLAAVESSFAPTLLETTATSAMPRVHPEVVGGSTIVGADQLVLFRIAQKQLGSTIADHMLLEVVGMGSLGFVFRAKHIPTRGELALKLIPHTSIRTPDLLARFIGECKMGLEVPGAVKLLHCGDSEEHAFVAMNFVRGRSLQSMIENEIKITPAEAVGIVAAVCKTLEAAHALGLVHRDVKPANILVLPDNSTALLDLGMGPKHDREGRSILARDERLDSTAFASPEITRQGAVDGRADVYSLAAVLFALLCGHRPFSAKSHIELIRKIRWESAPNLSELKPDTPAALCAEINRAMEKDPAARHASVSEFAAALAAAIQS